MVAKRKTVKLNGYVAGVGLKVKEARKKAKLSQAKLAALAGLDNVLISRLERGKHEPTLSTLSRIAEALGVTRASLLNERGP